MRALSGQPLHLPTISGGIIAMAGTSHHSSLANENVFEEKLWLRQLWSVLLIARNRGLSPKTKAAYHLLRSIVTKLNDPVLQHHLSGSRPLSYWLSHALGIHLHEILTIWQLERMHRSQPIYESKWLRSCHCMSLG